ncbi:MAG: helix-turn-helix transcriptional regulator [Paenibacillaceae bacterium]|nr:helix-turn-helix transcriptional regulator [Paenibacillaceae bacterium]
MRYFRNDEFMDDPSFPFRAMPAIVAKPIDIHTQEYMALVLVVEGSGRHEIAGTLLDISEGDAYLVEPGTTHAYHVCDNQPFMVYNVIFDRDFIGRELAVLTANDSFFQFFYAEPFIRRTNPEQPHLNLQRADRLRLRHMIEVLVEEDRTRGQGYKMFIKTALIQILIFLSRCNDRADRQTSLDASDELQMMRQIGEFISLHRTEPLTLEQMSRLCGMGTTSFSTKFKQYSGFTFIDYRNRLRIKSACEDLVQTNHKIMDIAMNAGFDDLSHFNKLFRSVTGVSPGEYRRNDRSRPPM